MSFEIYPQAPMFADSAEPDGAGLVSTAIQTAAAEETEDFFCRFHIRKNRFQEFCAWFGIRKISEKALNPNIHSDLSIIAQNSENVSGFMLRGSNALFHLKHRAYHTATYRVRTVSKVSAPPLRKSAESLYLNWKASGAAL